MPCNHPYMAFWTGNLTPNGKREYILHAGSDTMVLPPSAYERKRIYIGADAPQANIHGSIFLTDPIPLPCSKCIGCRIDRAKEWTYRCLAESLYHEYTYFVTLTYDDIHLPHWKDGSVYLSRRDLTRFFKRMRKAGYEFRYFASAEYGHLSNRPHFHFLMFTDKPLKLTQIGLNAFKCDDVEKIWSYGLVSVSYSDYGTTRYVTGYMQKKLDQDDSEFYVKPYRVMSRKPAIGAKYFYDHVDSIKSTQKVYLDGQTVKVPQIFWKYLDSDPDLDAIKKDLIRIARINLDKLKWFYNTPYTSEVGFKQDVEMEKALKRKEKL